jgi:hypothetical protein
MSRTRMVPPAPPTSCRQGAAEVAGGDHAASAIGSNSAAANNGLKHEPEVTGLRKALDEASTPVA